MIVFAIPRTAEPMMKAAAPLIVTPLQRASATHRAARPGTKLSKPAPGRGFGAVHVTPSVEVESTIVFPLQPGRKLQSAHATYIRPDTSTAAVGSAGARRNGRAASEIAETPTGKPKVAPPSTEPTA